MVWTKGWQLNNFRETSLMVQFLCSLLMTPGTLQNWCYGLTVLFLLLGATFLFVCNSLTFFLNGRCRIVFKEIKYNISAIFFLLPVLSNLYVQYCVHFVGKYLTFVCRDLSSDSLKTAVGTTADCWAPLPCLYAFLFFLIYCLTQFEQRVQQSSLLVNNTAWGFYRRTLYVHRLIENQRKETSNAKILFIYYIFSRVCPTLASCRKAFNMNIVRPLPSSPTSTPLLRHFRIDREDRYSSRAKSNIWSNSDNASPILYCSLSAG